ncbi:MAG: response regulator, partial [Candidatus Hodarchaeota archaeon]
KINDIVKATVKVITKKTVFSEIEKAVQARSWIDKLEEQLEQYKKLGNKIFLLPGDTILGKIYNIDINNRLIKMDIIGNDTFLSETQRMKVNKYLGIITNSDIKGQEVEIFTYSKKHNIYKTPDKILDYFSYFQKNVQDILIVDDDKTFCLNLREALDLIGFHVAIKYSGIETLNLFEEGKKDYDLILLDINLPDINGIEIANKLVNKFSFKNIILMTGDVDRILNIKPLPAMGILLKPFKAEEIINTIGKVIDTNSINNLTEEIEKRKSKFLDSQITIFDTTKYELSSSYDNRIRDILYQAIKETKADAGAIFSLDPLTYKVEMIESKNIDIKRCNRIRYKLPYSPIRDVIIDQEKIKFNNIAFHEGKFRNLLKLLDFQSCIGVEIDGIGGLGYCLFLFKNEVNRFHPLEEMFLKTEIASAKIGAVIKEKKFAEWSEQDQRFILDGQTLSALGHELKSKLTALEMRLFTLNTLLDTRGSWDRHLPQKIKEHISDVDILKEDMFNIVRDLLRFSKKDELKEINISECLVRAINSVQPFARELKIKINSLIANDLPVIRGLGIKLEQVLLNLLLNAIQNINLYKPDKKGYIYIHAYYDKNDEKLPIKVEITDTGPGIHKRNFEKIFEPMFTTKPDGVGMGLAISKGIIEAFKGDIYVKQSLMFLGSTFAVELPI